MADQSKAVFYMMLSVASLSLMQFFINLSGEHGDVFLPVVGWRPIQDLIFPLSLWDVRCWLQSVRGSVILCCDISENMSMA